MPRKKEYISGYKPKSGKELNDRFYKLGYIAANLANAKKALDLEKMTFDNMVQNSLIQLMMLNLQRAQGSMLGQGMPSGMGGIQDVAGMPIMDANNASMLSPEGGSPEVLPPLSQAPHNIFEQALRNTGGYPIEGMTVSEPLQPNVLQGFAI
ncbi:MAG: hypothetical protein KatS3mg083_115 [Candidatus Dojkabacteria bacterium]|nr:MAG: hypothetical protein KatS3mg083_115 [Candidatus Dojkabacteria bacterium]